MSDDLKADAIVVQPALTAELDIEPTLHGKPVLEPQDDDE